MNCCLAIAYFIEETCICRNRDKKKCILLILVENMKKLTFKVSKPAHISDRHL